MSDSTDQILEQLGNLGSAEGAAQAAQASTKLNSAGLQPTDKKDQWRILFVDLVYNLNSSFRDVSYWEGVKTEKDSACEIVKILHGLKEIPSSDHTVRISLRGSQGTKVSEKTDYVIRLGEFSVDFNAVSAVIRRMGIRLKHLEGRLLRSFEQFAAQGIDTIFIKIPDASEEALDSMRVSLRIISCFNQAVETDSDIKFIRNNQSFSLQPIRNEIDHPDPNLTQLAALNDLSAESMRQLVQKVSALMKRPEFRQSAIQFANVYQTIFHIKKFRETLRRPAIELNSLSTPTAQKSQPREQAGRYGGAAAGAALPDTDQTDEAQEGADVPLGSLGLTGLDPAVEKAEIARFVKESFGNSVASAEQAMKTIYSSDYKQLDLTGLENRLHQIVDLLQVIDSSGGDQPGAEAVREKVQTGLSQVPKELLDDLVVEDDLIKIWDGDEEKILGNGSEGLADIIDTSREKAAARKKIKAVLGADQHISDQDFEQVAEAFELSRHESQEIIEHFKGCFDTQKNFQRVLFEKKVPDFAGHPKKVFEVLWEFLKETPRRKDRLPFLNSLQLLVTEMGQPKQALKILLSDFTLNPTQINYPDRNALMLAIQFLRTYNKEINMDIEITPEEVLLVQAGLDQSAVRYAAWKVNGDQKRFVGKIAAIRKKLLASMETESSDDQAMQARFLMALEREVHIFAALVGGDTAAAVLRGALNVYGNPASQVYELDESRKYTSSLLQHLAIIIRGIGRVGQQTDIEQLDGVNKREQSFIDLSDEPRHAAQVRRTLRWIETTKNAICNRNDE
jgi:hypothetical protein